MNWQRRAMHKLGSLHAWTCARELAREVYQLTMRVPLARHFGLADQIRRAAASIPANIAEGYGLGTRRQLVRCLRIALGSTYELKCHLELAIDLALIPPGHSSLALHKSTRQIELLVGLLKKLSPIRRC